MASEICNSNPNSKLRQGKTRFVVVIYKSLGLDSDKQPSSNCRRDCFCTLQSRPFTFLYSSIPIDDSIKRAFCLFVYTNLWCTGTKFYLDLYWTKTKKQRKISVSFAFLFSQTEITVSMFFKTANFVKFLAAMKCLDYFVQKGNCFETLPKESFTTISLFLPLERCQLSNFIIS